MYGDCMEPRCIGKSHTDNLLAPTDLAENPDEKNTFLFWDESRSATLVVGGIEA